MQKIENKYVIYEKIFGYVNWIGFWTLYKKEVLRFLIVVIQTIISPLVTSLLFLLVLSLAIGSDRGNLRVSPSGFKNFDRWSQEMFEQEARELKNRKQFVNIEVEWANKGVKARVKRNVKRLERAKELKDQLEKDESSYRKAIQTVKINKIIPGLDNSKFIAEFHKVSIGYEIPKKTILKDINLKINKKDRIGLIGKNGTGKSTFLKALLGEIESQKGTIKLKKNMNFSYFDQLRNDLNNDNSLKKILVPSGGDYLKVQGKDRHVCSYLKDFMFDPSKATDSISTLSGGQQNRLLLAKVLANPQTGLILDEPTNDLDLETMDLLTKGRLAAILFPQPLTS